MAKQVEFKGRTYSVQQEIPVGPLAAFDGLLTQQIIVGAKGATGLLQTFSNQRRVIWSRGSRVQTEFDAVAA